MPPQVEILHRTTYTFDRPVIAAPHLIRLRPVASPWTVVLHHEQRISPAGHLTHWQQDPFGNDVARVSFVAPTAAIDIEVKVVAELTPRNPFDFLLDPSAERSPFRYSDELAEDLTPHLRADEPGPLLTAFLGRVGRAEGPTSEVVVGLGQAVAAAVRHQVRTEIGVWSPEETLRRATGSCRDSAWLLVQLLRHMGMAARFVSGYLVELAPTGDLTDLHAWAEVFLPGAGWVGIDATSGLLTTEGHIPLARSPHPRGAAPVVGTTEPCEVELMHSNSVRRLEGVERWTAPLTHRAAV
jgi:transglutaminase-like putative cysteine protease